MNKRDEVDILKRSMRFDLTNFYNKVKACDEVKAKMEVLRSLIDSIKEGIENNNFNINLCYTQLELVYDKDVAEKFYIILFSYFNNIDNRRVDESTLKELLRDVELLVVNMENDFDGYSLRFLELNSEMKLELDIVKGMKNVLYLFRNDKYITNTTKDFIIEYLKNNNSKERFIISVLERIRLYNNKVKGNTQYSDKSLIIDMFNKKLYEFKYTDLDLDIAEQFPNFGPSYYQIITDASDLDNSIFDLNLNSDYSTNAVVSYLFKYTLNKMIIDINRCVSDVSSLDIYNDSELRNVALMEYKELLKKYYYIFNYFKTNYPVIDVQATEVIDDTTDVVVPVDENVNTLLYVKSKFVDTSFLERDLKSFPKEYLEKLLNLLDGKRKGNLSPLKDCGFSGANKALCEYRKLKDDQVRILYRNLGNGYCLILGANVKKVDRDNNNYYKLTKRDINVDLVDVDSLAKLIAESETTDTKIKEYVKENARKSIR